MTAPGPDPEIRKDAWAKVNLTLQVTGRRDDGFHILDSLVVFARFGDVLEISPAGDLSLTLGGPFAGNLGTAQENLVLAAAAALRARFSVTQGAHIHLIKRLPVAAGLGGGSGDAAAALHALNELWCLKADAGELSALGATLGADVPVCLAGQASFLGGVGELLEPAPGLPPFWLVLVNPGIPLATPEVFKARNGPFSKPSRWRGPAGSLQDLVERLRAGNNDLEAPAAALVPEIGQVLSRLNATAGCLLARMSGSGATCFGIFSDRGGAQAAAVHLEQARPAWWVRAAPVGSKAL